MTNMLKKVKEMNLLDDVHIYFIQHVLVAPETLTNSITIVGGPSIYYH